MAHPIQFKPQPVDYHQELMARVEAAPRQHAEALLVAWDLLQTAHDKGLLDLAQGLIGGRDILAEKVATGMSQPEAVAAMRNAIALARILASLDPDMLHRVSRAMAESAAPMLNREFDNTQPKIAGVPHAQSQAPRDHKPASLWQLFKRATSEDGRRGLTFAVNLLTSFGRANRS